MTDAEVVHFPTPVIPPGSTLVTVIEGLLREAKVLGRPSSVLVEPWRGERFSPDEVRAASEPVFPHGRRARGARVVDHVLGAVAHRRPTVERLYESALRGVELPADASVLLHDGSFAFGGVRPTRRQFPGCDLYYYSHVPLSRSVGRRETRSLLARMNGWICVSRQLADSISARAGDRADNIVVVPNGVDTDAFSPSPDGLCDEAVIVWTGKVTPEKGPQHLLRALGRLQRSDWTLRIIGGNWYAPSSTLTEFERELRRLADQAGGTVEFVGYVPSSEVVEHLRAARIFCFPSVWEEPFGLALLEAMACGLACVTSRRGGIPEFAGDAVLYVDPENELEFAGALEAVLDDAALAADLGARARQQALRFSLAHQYQVLERELDGGGVR